jgi:parallel beta-helix repeat protein
MKLVFTILFLWSVAYGQTNYYVSNSGSDANNGLTTATAWQTISKVNSVSFSSGDSILFNRGDSWNERLVPLSSGIHIAAYGTGNKPIISGFQTVTGFTQSGNIWTKTISVPADLNMVLLNGNIAHKARYPNASELQYSSKDTNYLQTSLTGTPNYTGAQVVVRTAPWQLEKSTVTSQVGGKLNVSPNFVLSTPLQADLFFLQGLASLVDTVGEYNYDGTTLTVYSTTTPTVQVSGIDTLCWLRKLSNVTIDNISFVGAGKTAIQFDTCSVITVNNCSINYSGTVALAALLSSRLSILNDSITNSLSSAIRFMQIGYYSAMAQQCDSARVIGNYIKNTGVIAGMGEGGSGGLNNKEAVQGYYGIWIQGLNLGPYIANNIIDSTGYTGMELSGPKYVARNNIVSNFCFIKQDGGGIRSVIGSYPPGYNDSSLIVSNIAYNGIGTKVALAGAVSGASGVYLDVNSRRIRIDSNTLYNNVTAGVFLNTSNNVTLTNNNFYNNDFLLGNSTTTVSSTYFTNNSMFNSGYLIDATQINCAIGNFGTLDSNFYYSKGNIVNYLGTAYNLANWQTFYSGETHSSGWSSLANSANPTLLINTSLSPVTYNLVGTYIANGKSFTTITLPPTSSVLMFKAAYNIFNNTPLRLKKLVQ